MKTYYNTIRQQLLPNNIINQQNKLPLTHNGTSIICNILLQLIVLLTFGLSYPILGFAIVVTIIIEIIYRRLLIGKSIQLTIETQNENHNNSNEFNNQLNQFSSLFDTIKLQRISDKLKNSMIVMSSCLWIVCLTVTMFWSLLFIDMIANDYSYTIAMLATIGFLFGSNLLFYIISMNKIEINYDL